MNEIISNIDWTQVIITLWTVILLPVITYIGNEIRKWAKAKKIDKYTDILEKNVINTVKDVYETIVKDIKGTDEWTDEKKEEVKEIAKTKAIQALPNIVYETLKEANEDFYVYLDSLIGTSLYDLKNK